MQPAYPKISVVTFSFNHRIALKDSVISVLSQNYPNLEYLIIDAGSSDGSIEIIKEYADKLSYWVSIPGCTEREAMSRGFNQANGEIMALIKPGDKYLPWTFSLVAAVFKALPKVDWLGSSSQLILNNDGAVCHRSTLFNLGRKGFKDGCYVISGNDSIFQESIFWRRCLWMKVISTFIQSSHVINDSLWSNFRRYAILNTVTIPLAATKNKQIVNAATTGIGGVCVSHIRKFLLCFPLLGYFIGWKRGRIRYDIEANIWYCVSPTIRAIIRSLKRSISNISKLIY